MGNPCSMYSCSSKASSASVIIICRQYSKYQSKTWRIFLCSWKALFLLSTENHLWVQHSCTSKGNQSILQHRSVIHSARVFTKQQASSSEHHLEFRIYLEVMSIIWNLEFNNFLQQLIEETRHKADRLMAVICPQVILSGWPLAVCYKDVEVIFCKAVLSFKYVSK